MVPGLFDVLLFVFFLLVLIASYVQYRRDRLPRNRLLLVAGMALVWLANGLPDVTDGPPAQLAVRGPAATAVDVVSVVLAFAGIFLFYRFWRERGWSI